MVSVPLPSTQPGTVTDDSSSSYMRYLTTDGNCVLSLECSRRTGYVDGKSCRACGPGALACTGPESATKWCVDGSVAGFPASALTPVSPRRGVHSGTNSAEDQLYLNNGVCIERAECPDGTFADDGASASAPAHACAFPKLTTCARVQAPIRARPARRALAMTRRAAPPT